MVENISGTTKDSRHSAEDECGPTPHTERQQEQTWQLLSISDGHTLSYGKSNNTMIFEYYPSLFVWR